MKMFHILLIIKWRLFLKIKSGAIFLCLGLFMFTLSGCVTTTKVRFDSNVVGADVLLDGVLVGKTPFQKKMSNKFWLDPVVLIRKDGYEDLHTNLNKEVKVFNVVTGYFLCLLVPIIWSNGPKDYQYFIMYPQKTEEEIIDQI